jgi:molecular chaperone IbpA
VRVEGASLVNGMLDIALKREIPEALKPRRIEISGPKTVEVKTVEGKTLAA